MRKWTKFCICGLAAAMLVSGCGKKTENTETTAVETTAAETTAAETVEAVQGDGLSKVVSLGEYKGLEVEKADTEVTEEELQTQLDLILQANPILETVTDRAIQNGDTVNLNYVGKREDGTEFDSNTTDLVIGSGMFIDGFEEGLVGAESGSNVTLNLTFPESYFEESLAGQPAVFDVTINRISVEKEAELNDAFAVRVSNGEYTTIDAFKQSVKDTMAESKKNTVEQDMFYSMLGQIAVSSEFELTEPDVNVIAAEIKDYYGYMAAMYGVSINELLGKTDADLEPAIRESAEQTLKWNLILAEIADKEGLALVEEDYEKFAEKNGYESAEQLKAMLPEKNIKEALLIDKVTPFLIDNAVIK